MKNKEDVFSPDIARGIAIQARTLFTTVMRILAAQ